MVSNFRDAIGKSAVDTLFASNRSGFLLVFDDEIFRQLAHGENHVASVCTAQIIREFFNLKKISKIKFGELTLKLVGLNYQHISIDADLLEGCYESCGFEVTADFMLLLRGLGGKMSDLNSAAMVGVKFLRNVTDIPESKFRIIPESVIRSILSDRNPGEAVFRIRNFLATEFRFLPIHHARIEVILRSIQ